MLTCTTCACKEQRLVRTCSCTRWVKPGAVLVSWCVCCADRGAHLQHLLQITSDEVLVNPERQACCFACIRMRIHALLQVAFCILKQNILQLAALVHLQGVGGLVKSTHLRSIQKGNTNTNSLNVVLH